MGLVFLLCCVNSALAETRLDEFRLLVPIRHDSQVKHETGEVLKNRFQYQLSLYYGVQLVPLGTSGRLRLRGLVGSGDSYNSQWNTFHDLKSQDDEEHPINSRQIYLQADVSDWRLQVGVIPPVKGKVSNTSLDKDGWIRGVRIISPLPARGELELVTGGLDHIDSPNSFQSWHSWNYSEMEWTQPLNLGARAEAGYVLLDHQHYLRTEIRYSLGTKKASTLEISGELLRNLTTPNWAFDVMGKFKLGSFTALFEYSYVPETFGQLGQLCNDFFVIGHLGMLQLKGPTGLVEGVTWFSAAYLGEVKLRFKVGASYQYAL